MEVINNFLPSEQFSQLEYQLMSPKFPWYYQDRIVSTDDSGYQFTHPFYFSKYGSTSYHFNIFNATVQRLGVRELYRIKANLNPKTISHERSPWHVDLPDIKVGKTCVFYINTNNGWTEFKDGAKVRSVANRMVIFDCNLEHAGSTCTNENRRVVVNFNYA